MAPKKPKQLPPSGKSSANRPKAVAQRTATAVRQRVNQDVATIRALADNMRRNQARADRQIPADKSPSVRRVGPGGANPKPQGQLPPGQQRALPPGRPGGALVTTTSRRESAMNRQAAAGKGSSGTGVRTATGSAPKALPPASNRQPGTTRSEPTRRETAQYRQRLAAEGSRSSTVRTGQPGKPAPGSTLKAVGTTASRAANALASIGTATDAYSQARQRGETRGRSAAQGFSAAAGFAGGAAGGARLGSAFGPWGAAAGGIAGGILGSQGALRATQGVQEMGKAASKRGQDPNPPRPGSFGPPTPRTNLYSTVPGRPVGQQAVVNGKPVAWDGYNWKPSKSVGQADVDARRAQRTNQSQPAATTQRQRPAATELDTPRSASGSPTPTRSGGSTQARSTSTTPAATPGQKWSDFNPNRGTSKSNNPLLDRNDGYLRKKMQEREGKAAANAPSTAIGPVADGNTYSGNLKPATGMGPVRNAAEYSNMLKINKAKEDKKKKKS